MLRLTLLFLVFIQNQSLLASPSTCEEESAGYVIFLMKNKGITNTKISEGKYKKEIDCSKVDDESMKAIYEKQVIKCKSIVFPDGKTANIGGTPCFDDLISDDVKTCKLPTDWKVSDAKSIEDRLASIYGNDGSYSKSSCDEKTFILEMKGLISQFISSGISGVCKKLSKAFDTALYNSNDSSNQECDILDDVMDKTVDNIPTSQSSGACEIPDDSGLCPGASPSKPTSQTGFVQIEAPKKQRKTIKTGSLRNSGSSTISQ